MICAMDESSSGSLSSIARKHGVPRRTLEGQTIYNSSGQRKRGRGTGVLSGCYVEAKFLINSQDGICMGLGNCNQNGQR